MGQGDDDGESSRGVTALGITGAGAQENGGARVDSAIPARAQSVRTKVIRTATASERPSVGLGCARGNEPARIPLWPPSQYEVPTTDEPRYQQVRPETPPNQRLYVPLGSPPLVAVGSFAGAYRPPKPRAQSASRRMNSIAARVKTSRYEAGTKGPKRAIKRVTQAASTPVPLRSGRCSRQRLVHP